MQRRHRVQADHELNSWDLSQSTLVLTHTCPEPAFPFWDLGGATLVHLVLLVINSFVFCFAPNENGLTWWIEVFCFVLLGISSSVSFAGTEFLSCLSHSPPFLILDIAILQFPGFFWKTTSQMWGGKFSIFPQQCYCPAEILESLLTLSHSKGSSIFMVYSCLLRLSCTFR